MIGIRQFATIGIAFLASANAVSREHEASSCTRETSAAIASVARLIVRDSQGGEQRGTAFVIQVKADGPTGRSTVYLATAAHVFLGQRRQGTEARSAEDVFNEIEAIDIQLGASKADQFPLQKKFVYFPGSLSSASHWYDTVGEDIAILKIVGSEKRYRVLPIRVEWEDPPLTQFVAFGIRARADGPQPEQTVGEIKGAPGDDRAEQWIKSDASFEPGMSGGPAIFCEGKKAVVYALIQGRADPNGDLKYLVPFYISESFIRGRVPGFSGSISSASRSGSPRNTPGRMANEH